MLYLFSTRETHKILNFEIILSKYLISQINREIASINIALEPDLLLYIADTKGTANRRESQ
tara:strand:+ start:463 stop:645 length:183 start_codon:yes stop_codon:yes gene_type:complete